MAEMQRLLEIMQRLRAEDGCPWDREQTHDSLKPYLLEESYEVLEALEKHDQDNLCEELGDLLLQIVFHARIAEENGIFNFEDVVRGINEKMIRRHPHVFGEVTVKDSGEVLKNWDEIKAWEKKNKPQPKSALDGVVDCLPALMLSEKIQKKASKVGFDWDTAEGAWVKVKEEIQETEEALKNGDIENLSEEIGDSLFALVNVARLKKLHSELLLRDTVDKFKKRFYFIEERAKRDDKNLNDLTLAEMDKLWDEAKKVLKEEGKIN